MQVSTSDLSKALREAMRVRLEESGRAIHHCLDQLDEGQVWDRAADGLNSVANLVIHLSGNLRQRFGSDIGGEPSRRDRFGEFTVDRSASKAEILAAFDEAMALAAAAVDRLDDETCCQLRTTERLDGPRETSVLAIALQALTHLSGHAQEIQFMARLLLGPRYVFRSPEGVPPSMRPNP